MYEGNYKKIRDNVHGYIKVPVDFVTNFIDTDYFQRLRNIEQTGMRILYPSARHDRFIHSLGTYHLGRKAAFNFRANVKSRFSKETDFKKNHFLVIRDLELNDVFWEKCEVLFLVACLLHDCGHAPFSHSLEFFYEYSRGTTTEVHTLLQKKMFELFSSDNFQNDYDKNQGTPHERMSAVLVASEYADAVAMVIKERNLTIKKHKTDLRDYDDDLEFIARMIIGCRYKHSNTKATRIKNCFIDLLNSDSIDMDSLDYIIRDSHQSGIDNISVDVERLLSALTIVEKTTFNYKYIQEAEIQTNIVDSTLIPEINSSKCTANGQFTGKAEFTNFIAEINGYLSVDGSFKVTRGSDFNKSKSYSFTINGVPQDRINTSNSEASIEISGLPLNYIEILGSTIKTNVDFNCDINVQASELKFISTYFTGKLTGCFDGTLLGDYSRLGGNLICELGFHKSALNVLQNVLLARNYEYLWIYGHHKVVYYANYLIVELVREAIKKIIELCGYAMQRDEAISEIFSYQSMLKNRNTPCIFDFCGIPISMPNDSDIISIFKRCYLTCIDKNNFDKAFDLLTEYYTRKYKSSVWKSLAEFNIMFNDFSAEEKIAIAELFKSNGTDGVLGKYGQFPEWQENFSAFGMDEVVWVDGDSKIKFLDLDKTYILFKNCVVLNFRTAIQSTDYQNSFKTGLFYLYYKPNTKISFNQSAFKEFIKEKLRSIVD